MFRSFSIFCLFVTCYARPDINVQNVITVPPNCPAGQELINGVCRDVWKSIKTDVLIELGCAPGEIFFDGRCVQTLRTADNAPKAPIVVPHTRICPKGQQFVEGQCVWGANPLFSHDKDVNPFNVVTVPPNCPPGWELVDGVCREIWKQNLIEESFTQLKDVNPLNVVTAPPNCQPGWQLINGQCKEIWTDELTEDLPMELAEDLVNKLRDLILSEDRFKSQADSESPQTSHRKVINIPSQCPQGYKPDAMGVCREVFE